MKRVTALIFVMLLLLSGCAAPEEFENGDSMLITVDPEAETGETEQAPQETPSDTPKQPEETPESPDAETPEQPNDPIVKENEADIPAPEKTPETDEAVTISCMTFNVLCYEPDGIYPPASERAKASLQFLRENDCDIYGLQEAVDAAGTYWVPAKEIYDFDSYFREGLTEYDAISIVDTDAVGDGLMIFWKKDRFELKDSGGAEYTTNTNSCYLWVKLYDKRAGKELYVTNTHLSPNKNGDFEWGNTQRLPQSMQLASFWNAKVKNLPLLATGDYNCKVDNEYDQPHRNLQRSGMYYPTVNEAYASDGKAGYDHIYFNIEQMICETHLEMPREYNSVPMSDHCAILATFTYI